MSIDLFYHAAKNFCLKIFSDWFKVCLTLFKVLIPALIIIRILDQLGWVELLSRLLDPLMEPLGLPSSASLIWATTILTNIYGGLVVFVSYSSDWTLEQTTLLGVLMLGAHTLLVELSVARKAGCRVIPQFLMRVLGTYLLALLLHHYYQTLPEMQQPLELLWRPETQEEGWSIWLETQLISLFWTALIILGLVAMVHLIKVSGVERLLEYLLQPLLKLIGISRNALSMTLIGITLGLAYGGGLLIREAQKGQLTPQEVMGSITLLGLCHSLIEDTLLIALTGAELSGILWARLIWSLLIIALLTRLLPLIPKLFFNRWFATSVALPSSGSRT